MNLIDDIDKQLLSHHPKGDVSLKYYIDKLSSTDEGCWQSVTTTLSPLQRFFKPVAVKIEIDDNGKKLVVELTFNP